MRNITRQGSSLTHISDVIILTETAHYVQHHTKSSIVVMFCANTHATVFISLFDKCFRNVSKCVNVEQLACGGKKNINQFIRDLLDSFLSVVKTVNV